MNDIENKQDGLSRELIKTLEKQAEESRFRAMVDAILEENPNLTPEEAERHARQALEEEGNRNNGK